jgi:hypothetical protein
MLSPILTQLSLKGLYFTELQLYPYSFVLHTYTIASIHFSHSNLVSIFLITWMSHIKLITLWSDAASTNISAIGIGYLYLGVALFKSLKSIHTLNLPFFLNTGTMLEIQSAYQHGQINLASYNPVISAIISSYNSCLNLLGACLNGRYLVSIGSQCSTIHQLNHAFHNIPKQNHLDTL